jgi:hypothetical protein
MRRVCQIPGSVEFAERYKGRFGPINNYASSYDSAPCDEHDRGGRQDEGRRA